MCKLALEKGINSCNQDIHGQTVLFYVARDGRVDMISQLIKHNCNSNI